MGASKTFQYSTSELKSALIARALAHPARIRILTRVKQENFIRNIDLVSELHLVKSSINKHLCILKEADLIELEFFSNCYFIKPKHESIDKIVYHFEQFI